MIRLLALALALVLGTGATCTPAQGAADVTIGLNAAICVIETITSEEQGGIGEVQAIADAVIKCGVSAAQAAGVLSAHRKAETLDKCAPPKAAP